MSASDQSHRYERKFLVPLPTPVAVEPVIRHNPALFSPIYHLRTVNNIYLDSPALRLYFLNVDGATERTKVRIRWYGERLGEVAKPVLEFKQKQGLLGTKDSFPLKGFKVDTNFDAKILRRAVADSELPPPVRELLHGLEPALLNCYRRRYYRSADRRYRLTWDVDLDFYRLRAGHNALLGRAAPCPVQVLELKYDRQHAADAQAIADALPFRLTKMSKYVYGIDSLDGY